MNENINGIIYCDLDGVLCSFDGGVERITNKPISYFDNDEEVMWEEVEKYGLERFFIDLDWLPDGKQLWNYVISNFISVKILSAMGKRNEKNNDVYRGKMVWLRRYIPSLMESDIILVANKHKKQEYSRLGDIIIDDTKVVIDEWNNKGGIGILHKSTKETIKILDKYI